MGRKRFHYDNSQYLLVSAGLPMVSHIVEASKERPFLGARVVLDPVMTTQVLLEADHLAPRTSASAAPLTISTVSAGLLDAVVRLVRLVETPRDYKVIAPLIMREVVYRLLVSEQRGRLRQIAAIGPSERRMSKAISGDLYHYAAARELKRLPTFDFNQEQSVLTRAAVETFLKESGATLWIQHDFTANAQLKKSPLYYD